MGARPNASEEDPDILPLAIDELLSTRNARLASLNQDPGYGVILTVEIEVLMVGWMPEHRYLKEV